jgi:phage regulator Rha-like protein
MTREEKRLLPQERIERMIHLIRGERVMLDHDLAGLYNVETKQLKRQVRRNADRFPADFVFVLSRSERDSLRCHFGTLKRGQHSKYTSFAFTESGVAMLSSVLNSARAIQVNIQIMRAFIKLRRLMATHEDLRRRIEEMEKKYDHQFTMIFSAIKSLLEPPPKPKRRIGFIPAN